MGFTCRGCTLLFTEFSETAPENLVAKNKRGSRVATCSAGKLCLLHLIGSGAHCYGGV